MLPGILTTALEIVIVLDLCGVAVYFGLSALNRYRRGRKGADVAAPQVIYPPQLQPCTAGGLAAPRINASGNTGLDIYAGTAPEPEAGARTGLNLMAGLKRRLASLKGRFTYAPAAAGAGGVEARDMETDHQKLGRILDSFKEET